MIFNVLCLLGVLCKIGVYLRPTYYQDPYDITPQLIIKMQAATHLPKLQVGQTAAEWRVLFEAAVALIKEEKENIKLLPLAINRSSSDRAWAVRAKSKDTLREALDELVFLIDGHPSRLVAAGNFFSVRPNETLTQANLAEYFFKVLDSGKTAGMNFDVIAIKFLQHVPHGHKTYTEWEARINAGLDEAGVISIFYSVRNHLSSRGESASQIKGVKADVFNVQKEEVMPRWAKGLAEEVNELKRKITIPKHQEPLSDSSCSSEHELFKVETMDVCNICGKSNHEAKNCFKRKCKKCTGNGHDAEKPIKVSPKEKTN